MYGKLFDSMYDGTLYGQWQALVTFQQMIILADADGTIDITPPALAARTGIPLEIITQGIEVLESPDPYSRTEGEDGRRIVRIDDHRPWGWYIVNHAKYKNLQDADTVREQTRERVRKHREKKRIEADGNAVKRTVTDGNGQKRHTDTDTDINTRSSGDDHDLEFDQFWSEYPKKVAKADARKAFKSVKATKHLADILADIKRRRANCEWRDPKFIPYPASYLRSRRWEDEGVATTTVEPYL